MGATALHGAECFRNEYSCPRLDSGNPAGRALLLRGPLAMLGTVCARPRDGERKRERERESVTVCGQRPT